MFTINLCCGALVKFGDIFIGKSSYFVKKYCSSGGHQSALRESSGGHQVFIRLSSGDHQVIIKWLSSSHCRNPFRRKGRDGITPITSGKATSASGRNYEFSTSYERQFQFTISGNVMQIKPINRNFNELKDWAIDILNRSDTMKPKLF